MVADRFFAAPDLLSPSSDALTKLSAKIQRGPPIPPATQAVSSGESPNARL
jgi:hypothetical protein